MDKMLNKENDTFAVVEVYRRYPPTRLTTLYMSIYKLLYVHNKFRRVYENANIKLNDF